MHAGGCFRVFAIGPDLAFFAGVGQKATLVHGQMPSRAVPAYNALHRVSGPIALGLLAALGVLPPALLVGRSRLGVSHLPRPRDRLRVAHPRWLPARLMS